MSSYFDQAKEFITNTAGKDFVILKESVHDLPDFFSFTYQSKKYLETENTNDAFVGQGYNFISKSDERIFTFNSGLNFERALSELENMLSKEAEIREVKPEFDIQKQYNLKISTVLKKQLLVDSLLKFKVTYIIPQWVGNSLFKVPRNYTKKLLFERLAKAPTVFHGIGYGECSSLIIELIKSSTCEFDLIEQDSKKALTPNENSSDPIW